MRVVVTAEHPTLGLLYWMGEGWTRHRVDAQAIEDSEASDVISYSQTLDKTSPPESGMKKYAIINAGE